MTDAEYKAAYEIIETADAALKEASTAFPDTPENRIALASFMVNNGIKLYAATMGADKTRLLVSDMLAALDDQNAP